MPPNSKSPDTLYGDLYGEMEDYELALFECDGIGMGRSIAETDPAEDGQSLVGIWSLFGIEVCLAAAGVPSESDNCTMIRKWAEEKPHPLDAARVEDFKARVREIAKLRIADDCDPDEINAAAGKMIGRIEKAALNASTPCAPVVVKEPTPVKEALARAEKPQASSPKDSVRPSPEAPPWWPELLSRCRDAVEESMDPAIFTSRLVGRMDPDRIARFCRESDSYYWKNNPFYPVMDPSLVDWLLNEAGRDDGSYPSLLEYAIEPTLLGSHPFPEVRVSNDLYPRNFECEAKRVLYLAALSLPPSGLRDLLPRVGHEGIGVFEGGYLHCKKGEKGKALITYLLSGWAGASGRDIWTPEIPHTVRRPSELWEEIKDLTLLNDIEAHIRTSNNRPIHITHAWCAWCAGTWDEETLLRLFPVGVASEYSRHPMSGSEFRCEDPRFSEFCEAFNASVAECIPRLAKAGNLDELQISYQFHRGEVALDTMLSIAEHFTNDHSPDDFRNLLGVTHLPEGNALKTAIFRLKSIPQPILRRIVPYTGVALPYVIDVIEDSDFVYLTKAIAGAFAEPMIIDQSDHFQHSAPEASDYYPGRTASGVTNLNPLYQAFADSSTALIKEVIEVLGGRYSVEGGHTRLELMAGIPPQEESYPNFRDNPEVVRLTHRIPKDPQKWEKERQERIDGLADLLMTGNRYDRESIFRWGLNNVRDAAKLYAESLDQDSWQGAAYEMAGILKRDHPLEAGGYVVEQAPLKPGGQIISKNGRRLKKIPSTQFTLSMMADRNRANLLNLLHLMLSRETLDDFIETGKEPGEATARQHEKIFGLNLKTWISERQSQVVFEPLATALQNLIEFHVKKEKSDPEGKSSRRENEPPFPNTLPVNLEKLQELGWPTGYWAKAQNYDSERKFPRYRLSLIVRPYPSSRAKASGLPSEEQLLRFESIDLWKDTPLEPGDPRILRIARCIAQEIALAGE